MLSFSTGANTFGEIDGGAPGAGAMQSIDANMWQRLAPCDDVWHVWQLLAALEMSGTSVNLKRVASPFLVSLGRTLSQGKECCP
jgi:hypothetical protein